MTTVGARMDKLIQEKHDDTYRTKGKLGEPTACPDCGAVYHQGRWQWLESMPKDAQQQRCPACQRIADKVPAGVVTISGEFFSVHREELLGLIKNIEAYEKQQHPLNRIMAMSEQAGGLEITTTDVHLPRDIGVALEKAYDGELDFHYVDESGQLRVHWQR